MTCNIIVHMNIANMWDRARIFIFSCRNCDCIAVLVPSSITRLFVFYCKRGFPLLKRARLYSMNQPWIWPTKRCTRICVFLFNSVSSPHLQIAFIFKPFSVHFIESRRARACSWRLRAIKLAKSDEQEEWKTEEKKYACHTDWLYRDIHSRDPTHIIQHGGPN